MRKGRGRGSIYEMKRYSCFLPAITLNLSSKKKTEIQKRELFANVEAKRRGHRTEAEQRDYLQCRKDHLRWAEGGGVNVGDRWKKNEPGPKAKVSKLQKNGEGVREAYQKNEGKGHCKLKRSDEKR